MKNYQTNNFICPHFRTKNHCLTCAVSMVFTPEFVGFTLHKIIINATFLAMEHVKYSALTIGVRSVISAACQTLSKGEWPACWALNQRSAWRITEVFIFLLKNTKDNTSPYSKWVISKLMSLDQYKVVLVFRCLAKVKGFFWVKTDT